MKTNSQVFGVAAVLITLLFSPAIGWTGEETSRVSGPRSTTNDKSVKRTLIIDGYKVQVYTGSKDARTDAEIVKALRSLNMYQNEIDNESQLREHLNRIGIVRAEDIDGLSSAPERIPLESRPWTEDLYELVTGITEAISSTFKEKGPQDSVGPSLPGAAEKLGPAATSGEHETQWTTVIEPSGDELTWLLIPFRNSTNNLQIGEVRH